MILSENRYTLFRIMRWRNILVTPPSLNLDADRDPGAGSVPSGPQFSAHVRDDRIGSGRY
jgi:hypothetical protein